MFGSAESQHPRLTNGEIVLDSNLCDQNPPTSQTDRQTTCDRKTALCTKVHRAVKTTTIRYTLQKKQLRTKYAVVVITT